MEHKRPKLWNGPHALGEGLVRGLELTGAPYLSARAGDVYAGVMQGKGEVKFGIDATSPGFMCVPHNDVATAGWLKDDSGAFYAAPPTALDPPEPNSEPPTDARLVTSAKKVKVLHNNPLKAKHVSWIGDWAKTGDQKLLLTYDHGLPGRYRLSKYDAPSATGTPDLCMNGRVIRTGSLAVVGACVTRFVEDGQVFRYFVIAVRPPFQPRVTEFYYAPFIKFSREPLGGEVSPSWTLFGVHTTGSSSRVLHAPWFFSPDGKVGKSVAHQSTPPASENYPHHIPTWEVTTTVTRDPMSGNLAMTTTETSVGSPMTQTIASVSLDSGTLQVTREFTTFEASSGGVFSTYAAAKAKCLSDATAYAAANGWSVVPYDDSALVAAIATTTFPVTTVSFPGVGRPNPAQTGGIVYHVESATSVRAYYTVTAKSTETLGGVHVSGSETTYTLSGNELLAIDFGRQGEELRIEKRNSGAKTMTYSYTSTGGGAQAYGQPLAGAYTVYRQFSRVHASSDDYAEQGIFCNGVLLGGLRRPHNTSIQDSMTGTSTSTGAWDGLVGFDDSYTAEAEAVVFVDVDARFELALLERLVFDVSGQGGDTSGPVTNMTLFRTLHIAGANITLRTDPRSTVGSVNSSTLLSNLNRPNREVTTGRRRGQLAVRPERLANGVRRRSILVSTKPNAAEPESGNASKWPTYWVSPETAEIPSNYLMSYDIVVDEPVQLFKTPIDANFAVDPVRPI